MSNERWWWRQRPRKSLQKFWTYVVKMKPTCWKNRYNCDRVLTFVKLRDKCLEMCKGAMWVLLMLPTNYLHEFAFSISAVIKITARNRLVDLENELCQTKPRVDKVCATRKWRWHRFLPVLPVVGLGWLETTRRGRWINVDDNRSSGCVLSKHNPVCHHFYI